MLRLQVTGPSSAFTFDRQGDRARFRIATEKSRGYEWQGSLWSPGYFRSDLAEGDSTTLVASTESWETILALSPEGAFRAELDRRRLLLAAAPPQAREGAGAELVLAADQFLITPAGRVEDATRARAQGDEIRTVIAGYHWFTDWGRDTMISLEGLTLATGRTNEAGWILRTFAHYVRDGLIPNLFPEGERAGPLSHGRRHAVVFPRAPPLRGLHRGPRPRCGCCCPSSWISSSTICAARASASAWTPQDGLLRQGQQGYQLTWMDAKVGDWVVTPRRGKAVEINALWYNALRLLEEWLREEEGDGQARHDGGNRRPRLRVVQRAVLERGGRLSLRRGGRGGRRQRRRLPSQPGVGHLAGPPGARRAPWKPVMDVVTERLLTPVGLRSLAPGHPDYKPRYYGDLRSRDAAYHQGTVWAWLIGPYIDAWLKVHPDQVAGGAAAAGGLRAAPGRAVHRLDQRDLRRRAAVHAARLHRAGVERGGGAALLAEDGAAILIRNGSQRHQHSTPVHTPGHPRRHLSKSDCGFAHVPVLERRRIRQRLAPGSPGQPRRGRRLPGHDGSHRGGSARADLAGRPGHLETGARSVSQAHCRIRARAGSRGRNPTGARGSEGQHAASLGRAAGRSRFPRAAGSPSRRVPYRSARTTLPRPG